jgi:hypothetical protein
VRFGLHLASRSEYRVRPARTSRARWTTRSPYSATARSDRDEWRSLSRAPGNAQEALPGAKLFDRRIHRHRPPGCSGPPSQTRKQAVASARHTLAVVISPDGHAARAIPGRGRTRAVPAGVRCRRCYAQFMSSGHRGQCLPMHVAHAEGTGRAIAAIHRAGRIRYARVDSRARAVQCAVPPSSFATRSADASVPVGTAQRSPVTAMPRNAEAAFTQLSRLSLLVNVTTSRSSPASAQPDSSRANSVGEVWLKPVQWSLTASSASFCEGRHVYSPMAARRSHLGNVFTLSWGGQIADSAWLPGRDIWPGG